MTVKLTAPIPVSALGRSPKLSANNGMGLLHFLGEMAFFILGLWLSTSGNIGLWLLSQCLLAFVLLHAFILLHEAGHGNLFRQRWLNTCAGVWASLLALIPLVAWRKIHARHHRYTGWQDLDATTASLVPRQLSGLEQKIINFAWASYFPLFSLLYRIQNFWNWKRLARFLPEAADRRAIGFNIAVQLRLYGAAFVFIGASRIFHALGLAWFLSAMMQDIFILSQHTHIPQNLSGGQKVPPFSAAEQVQFTRSLLLPPALGWLLMHNDRHALHHQYPGVPGYHLSALPDGSEHQIHWWTWLKAAKALSGTQFLFSNRHQTGFEL